MNLEIVPSKIFLHQLKNIDKKSKKIIYDKIQLIKENPFRYKKIHSKSFSKVFRVRLKIQSKETRIIYIVAQKIILACLLDRKKDYKDLEKYLSRIKE